MTYGSVKSSVKGALLCRDPDAPPGAELIQDGIHEAVRQAAPAAAVGGGLAPGESGGRAADGAAEGAGAEERERRR